LSKKVGGLRDVWGKGGELCLATLRTQKGSRGVSGFRLREDRKHAKRVGGGVPYQVPGGRVDCGLGKTQFNWKTATGTSPDGGPLT